MDINDNNIRNRKVFWKYRKSGAEKIIAKNLTRNEARKMVSDNEKTNPSTNVKMMCFDIM